MITEFKDNLRNFKTMLKELKKLDKIKRQQILKIDKMVDEIEELKTKKMMYQKCTIKIQSF